ncbi:MAG: 50S ribosomal protein L28 [Candidatus Levybacteria bacterium]|nr:50S ribosomal protein L28 [Candidatus Levybacteria bacterium]
MRTCSLCGKGTSIGRNRSHAQNRTSRTYKANIHKVSLLVGTTKVGGKFCSKCLKSLKREVKQKTALV